MAKKIRGRGEVEITKATPKIWTKKAKEDTITNSYMHKAMDNLRQARRCEQINHRMMRGREAGDEKKEKYKELNNITIKGIKKNLDLKDDIEKISRQNSIRT